MHIPWMYEEYFDMLPAEQEFAQKMLFYEYMEECVQLAHAAGEYVSLTRIFLEDLQDHEDREHYETCKLYQDTFIRFKSEFIDHG